MTILPVAPGTDQLQRAFDRAMPGDVIELLPGEHTAPAILTRSGTADRPIRIRALPGARIDGRTIGKPDVPPPLCNGNPRSPRDEDFAFVKLMGVAGIVIEGLDAANCWPTIVYANESHDIAIRRCRLRHGSYAIFLRGDLSVPERSGNWLIEDCSWVQDDSPEHLLWSAWDWRTMHGGEGGNGKLRHYNGAFFGAYDVGSGFVLRRNTIRDAFNAMRFGASEPSPRANCNVHIYENDFIRIRDNPIEPEGHAHLWFVRHNRLTNCHTWFSFDAVTGGFWYIYGNLGGFTSKQGGGNHERGKVLKFSQAAERVPVAPVHIFGNSFYLRCPLAAGDPAPARYRLAHLRLFDNAFEFCTGSDHPAGVCDPNVDYVGNIVIEPESCRFDANISNHRSAALAVRVDDCEVFPQASSGPLFRDGRLGDLALRSDSVARGGATRAIGIVLPDCLEIPSPAHDVGAWQGAALLSVPELEVDPPFVAAMEAAAQTAS